MANLTIVYPIVYLPKKTLDKLPSVYDLDLFNLNINSNINPDTNFLCKQIRCNYYSPHKFCDLKKSTSNSCLSFLHNNIRSLKRNLDNFQNHLLHELSFSFTIIGLSETRITNADSNSLTFNPNIPGYNFEYGPTPLSAGGVGMYIKEELNYGIIERTSNDPFKLYGLNSNFQRKQMLFVEYCTDNTILQKVFKTILNQVLINIVRLVNRYIYIGRLQHKSSQI